MTHFRGLSCGVSLCQDRASLAQVTLHQKTNWPTIAAHCASSQPHQQLPTNSAPSIIIVLANEGEHHVAPACEQAECVPAQRALWQRSRNAHERPRARSRRSPIPWHASGPLDPRTDNRVGPATGGTGSTVSSTAYPAACAHGQDTITRLQRPARTCHDHARPLPARIAGSCATPSRCPTPRPTHLKHVIVVWQAL